MDHLKRLGYYLKILTSVKQYKGYWVKIEDIIIIVICGTFCGLSDLGAIYDYANSKPGRKMLKQVFGIFKIPSYSHFLRLLKKVDIEELNESFRCWCHWILTDLGKKITISLDGKTVKSTVNMNSYERPLHIVSAVVAEYGITIGQMAVESKSNEIPAVQELIKILDIAGTVITADALNCQKKTARIIIDNKADYVLAVKSNHENLYSDLKDIFDYVLNNKVEKYKKEYKKDIIETYEKNRDRFETRTSCVIYDIEWLENREEWSGLKAIGMVKLKKECKEKTTEEVRYYLLSDNFTAKDLIYYTRNEWSVETMHWLLDVNLKEDKCRVENINVQKSLNIIRKVVLNTLKIYKDNLKISTPISKIMRNCLFDTDELIKLLADTRLLEAL